MNFDISILYELFVALLIGVVQGITEFLPVSSSAHQLITSTALLDGTAISLQVSNIIQLGTLIAIVQYFWSDLKMYFFRLVDVLKDSNQLKEFNATIKDWFAGADQDQLDDREHWQTDVTIAQIAVGTIPIVILGGFLYSFASDLRSILMVAAFLVLGSGLMILAEKIFPKTLNHEENQHSLITAAEAGLIGIFQSLAIFPGISRSGATMSGALLIGKKREQAARFSFLLAVPAILLAGIKDTISFTITFFEEGIPLLPDTEIATFSLVALLLAFIASYMAGIVTLRWLISYLSKNSLNVFIWYRFGLAAVLLVWYFVSALG